MLTLVQRSTILRELKRLAMEGDQVVREVLRDELLDREGASAQDLQRLVAVLGDAGATVQQRERAARVLLRLAIGGA